MEAIITIIVFLSVLLITYSYISTYKMLKDKKIEGSKFVPQFIKKDTEDSQLHDPSANRRIMFWRTVGGFLFGLFLFLSLFFTRIGPQYMVVYPWLKYVFALVLLITACVFFILWNKEKNIKKGK